jgi:hypothetical protein
MINDVDDAASAFRAANPVPAGAFEDAARSPQAAQTLERIMTTRPGWAARHHGHRWLRPAIVAAPLAGIAAAVAITLVLVTTGGGATTRIATAAYTVTKSPDGSVSVLFDPGRAFNDPTGLSRALSSQGVPNRVLFGRPSCPPGSEREGKTLPASRYVFSAGRTANSEVIHPNRMPRGSVVVIMVAAGPGVTFHGPGHATIPAGGYFVIGVNLTDHAPTCLTEHR